MLRSVILSLSLIIVFNLAAAAQIVNLIQQGHIDEARREIAEASTAARRDGTILYCQALLETDGQKSFQFLEAAFKAELSPEFLENDIYLTALYHMANRDYSKAATTCEAYLQHWEAGAHRSEILRLLAFASSELGQSGRSQNYLNSLVKENPQSTPGYVGKLDQARNLYNAEKYGEADKICRKLRSAEFDDAVIPALYLLSHYSLERNKIDDAILYYNILKEAHPNAIGLDDLTGKLGGYEKMSNDQVAERITGTTYSVQVGVFSVGDNARNFAGRLKKYGEPVEINEKMISGKKYYVVYAGRFLSSEKAMAFKTRLESSEKEAFQVIAR